MTNADGNKGMQRGVKEFPFSLELNKKIKETLELGERLKNKWEEEFEDELNCILKIDKLIKKYLKWHSKVKIKCRKGAILIERIE